MAPPDVRSGPPGATQLARLQSQPATTPSDIAMLWDTSDSRQRGRTPLPAYVSAYEPFGRRRWWWFSYRCPVCWAYQFGRARSLDQVTGERRGGCGHRLSVVIARTYARPGDGG